MVNWFSIIRPINLLFIAAIMVLMKYALIHPFLDALSETMNTQVKSLMDWTAFLALVFSVLSIAAGGYLINDVQDIETDRINKPNRFLVTHPQFLKKATSLSYVLFIVGLFLGLFTAYFSGNIYLALIHVIAISSLYVYAISLKKTLLIGNLIVAFMGGLVPLIVGLYEITQLQSNYTELFERFKNFNFNFLAYWILGFSAFAFILTLAREITKDAEDVNGDMENGATTLPVTVGFRITKVIIASIYALFLVGLFSVYTNFLSDRYTLYYLLLVVLLTLAVIWLTVRAKSPRDFNRAALANKLLSFIGLAYCLLVGYMVVNGKILPS